jgi:hypothetical protein
MANHGSDQARGTRIIDLLNPINAYGKFILYSVQERKVTCKWIVTGLQRS